MNRDKQIEEKRELSDIIYWSGYGFDRGTCNDISNQIQEQGYLKASEVAKEIFEEIEKETKNHGICYTQRKIAELKKKYTQEE